MLSMRSTTTAVLERKAKVRTSFTTEPYELPWAGEARFFVHALEFDGDDTSLEFITQISPDGLHWCDLDDVRHRVDSVGVTSWLVTGFGQWLRLSCRVTGPEPAATVRIYLVGKS
ncbi:hypothetical protein SAMN05216215_102912 [Saccharopolyspora shandongensis]|uniref:Uncharacterized protein n=2 Tax=Saccharopolyspora shandongensis TaxID=418495 RepID=A0A1H3KTZ7_9PSEU|nr:hypothetical protein SAMN05216215_102912 [Saccharopolyspora shandongensis]